MRQLVPSAVFALIAVLALIAIAAVAMSGTPRRSGFASPAATALATTKPIYDANAENGVQTTFSQFKASAPAAAPKDAAIHADLVVLHRDMRNEFTADGIDKYVLG
jgi:hypothetical protein